MSKYAVTQHYGLCVYMHVYDVYILALYITSQPGMCSTKG